MKTFFYIIITVLLSFNALSQEKKPKLIASCETGGCTGNEYCSACKNCSGCKHCAKEGGTCGVCSTPVKKKTTITKSKKKTQKKR